MSAPNVPEMYTQYLIPLILSGVKNLVGMPRTMAVDEKAFRQAAIEPVWNSLPLPFRMVGRDQLRWTNSCWRRAATSSASPMASSPSAPMPPPA